MQSWMVRQGNHEIKKIPVIHGEIFTAYNARRLIPFLGKRFHLDLYYSFEVGGVHVLMFGSYAKCETRFRALAEVISGFGKGGSEHEAVGGRCCTYAVVHTNEAQQGEYGYSAMKKVMEELLNSIKLLGRLANSFIGSLRCTYYMSWPDGLSGPTYAQNLCCRVINGFKKFRFFLVDHHLSKKFDLSNLDWTDFSHLSGVQARTLIELCAQPPISIYLRRCVVVIKGIFNLYFIIKIN